MSIKCGMLCVPSHQLLFTSYPVIFMPMASCNNHSKHNNSRLTSHRLARPTQGAAAAADAGDGAEAEPPQLLLDEGQSVHTRPHPHQQRVPDIRDFSKILKSMYQYVESKHHCAVTFLSEIKDVFTQLCRRKENNFN